MPDTGAEPHQVGTALEIGKPLPYGDASIDVAVADYVLEHLPDPDWFAREISRILKPGGWLCARTPTKWHYVSVASRLLPASLKDGTLARAQPDRKPEDVFEAHYRINSQRDVARLFPSPRYENCSYIFSSPSPSYHFNSRAMFRMLSFAHAILPASTHGNLFVFVKKAQV
jgi:ubiquinone/menaquinone biosynthesis C-methylase UbiE